MVTHPWRKLIKPGTLSSAAPVLSAPPRKIVWSMQPHAHTQWFIQVFLVRRRIHSRAQLKYQIPYEYWSKKFKTIRSIAPIRKRIIFKTSSTNFQVVLNRVRIVLKRFRIFFCSNGCLTWRVLVEIKDGPKMALWGEWPFTDCTVNRTSFYSAIPGKIQSDPSQSKLGGCWELYTWLSQPSGPKTWWFKEPSWSHALLICCVSKSVFPWQPATVK